MEEALLNNKNDDDDYDEDDDEEAADMEEFEESGMLENDEVGKTLTSFLLPVFDNYCGWLVAGDRYPAFT